MRTGAKFGRLVPKRSDRSSCGSFRKKLGLAGYQCGRKNSRAPWSRLAGGFASVFVFLCDCYKKVRVRKKKQEKYVDIRRIEESVVKPATLLSRIVAKN